MIQDVQQNVHPSRMWWTKAMFTSHKRGIHTLQGKYETDRVPTRLGNFCISSKFCICVPMLVHWLLGRWQVLFSLPRRVFPADWSWLHDVFHFNCMNLPSIWVNPSLLDKAVWLPSNDRPSLLVTTPFIKCASCFVRIKQTIRVYTVYPVVRHCWMMLNACFWMANSC